MIEVLQPGLLTSVQDLGRFGYQQYGVIVSGAMDPVALRVGNLLVGNSERSSGLEITLMGPKLHFGEDTLIAVTGDGLAPVLNGDEMPLWRQVYVKSGSILEFRPRPSGCRSYLCVAGGIRVPAVMGSQSTYLRAGIGGYEGRALKSGDKLECGPISRFASESMATLGEQGADIYAHWFPAVDILPAYRKNPVLRVLPGSQMNLFRTESLEALQNKPFQVTPQSDRMGYRLSGPRLELTEPEELISEAVTVGTIQVPPEGNPIVLMADRQTTGGYPKIAQVASVDIPVMAQVRPGELVGFELITVEEAQLLMRVQEQELQSFARGLKAGINRRRA